MLSTRQIHLDYHTSEHIPNVGADFDTKLFAKTAKEAFVNSMTVFAKCHHGWLYYPSKTHPELIHPNLKKTNLLLEQINSLHEVGIKAPVYITVQWDYHSAVTHPEWLIRKEDGSHEGDSFDEPGFYQSLCVNTGYYQLLKEHTIEVCTMLGDKLDGIFFDIVGIRPCLCSSCRKEMKDRGIDATNELEVRKFAKLSLDRFKFNITNLVREYNKNCTIFYNCGHTGPCQKDSIDAYTHLELESLPGDRWGYLHFPAAARYARTMHKDAMGMTGKFHTSWGDFHSLKNLAALEFECFRMLSFGYACSIGDQMEPRGVINPSTYKLIGKVYEQVAEREEWARPSIPIVEAAVVTSERDIYEDIPDSVYGALTMLEELGLQFDIIDTSANLLPYKLVLLVDDLICDGHFQDKLNSYTQSGGKVISCYKGGFDGQNMPECFGISYQGEHKEFPDFIIASEPLGKDLELENQYVIYMQGADISLNGATKLLSARSPYFKREGDKFCSHRYTPSAGGADYPVATHNGNVIYFAHPLYTQYRECAPQWVKSFVKNAIDELLPHRLVRHNGPSTMTVQILEQPKHNRYAMHILSYVPVRKSKTIDIIEERTQLYNITFELKLPNEIKSARIVPGGTKLCINDGKITVPVIDGYTIIELVW